MIKHIFKIIWAERKTNLWIVIGLILVFTVLWFCNDYFTTMARRAVQPLGFDIENTYILEFHTDPTMLENMMEEARNRGEDVDEDDFLEELSVEYGWKLYERVKGYKKIETVALSYFYYPYFSGGSWRNFLINKDSVFYGNGYRTARVSPEYFELFGIELESGRLYSWEDAESSVAIVSGELFGKTEARDVKTLSDDIDGRVIEVVGSVSKMKSDEYSTYECGIYMPFERKYIADFYDGISVICVRAKKGVSRETFVAEFIDDMADQLTAGPFSLIKVRPMEDVRREHIEWMEYKEDFIKMAVVTGFLLVNIFLGLIGIFWFRTRERRSEIGLRMAMGSTGGSVERLFVGEVFLMVCVATVFGAILGINLTLADVVDDMDLHSLWWRQSRDWVQYLLNFGATFIMIAGVSVLAVWYPARRAAMIEPSEALRDE